MSRKEELVELKSFLSLFPEVELPITLSSEYIEVFSKHNKSLSEIDIHKYILGDDVVIPIDVDYDSEELLEDEYIACIKLPDTNFFHGVVYLRIGILKYEYILHTFNLNGDTISRQLVASMTSEGNVIKEHVALMDEDLIILIMEGGKEDEDSYNPNNSNLLSYEINEKGEILKYNI